MPCTVVNSVSVLTQVVPKVPLGGSYYSLPYFMNKKTEPGIGLRNCLRNCSGDSLWDGLAPQSGLQGLCSLTSCDVTETPKYGGGKEKHSVVLQNILPYLLSSTSLCRGSEFMLTFIVTATSMMSIQNFTLFTSSFIINFSLLSYSEFDYHFE